MQTLTKETLRIFWKHAWRYRGLLLLTYFVGSVVVPLINAYLPLLYRDLIDTIAVEPSQSIVIAATHILVLVLAWHIVRIVMWRGVGFVNSHFQPRVMGDLMNTCYRYLQQHSFSFFTSNFVGSLVTRVKRYERAFEVIADQFLFDLGHGMLNIIVMVAILLFVYPLFGVLLLTWIILFLCFSYAFAVFKIPYDIQRARADTRTTAQLADTITNNTNIKAFSSYETEYDRFAETIDDQFRLRRLSWNLGTLSDGLQGLMMIGLEFAVMYLAIKMWGWGALSVGDVTLLQVYMMRIYERLWNTGKNIRSIYEALADGNEMTEMLMQPHDIQDAPNAKPLVLDKGAINFDAVTFKYIDGAAVLNKFDLEITSGERVAFIGPSGGGKSTIIKLLFRFYDIQKGKITIDGQNISKVTQDSLRNQIAFVPQDPILFHRSLMENIRYAKPNATDDEVMEAARLAHAHEFIKTFPQSYDTLVGERGVKLSGGERQRVAIARAILKDAPILVLDEATSSLDSESERYIQDALTTLMKGRTTIVVAHRLSTIMQMDRIIVIENGKIVEQGKHQELLKAKEGTYQRLWEIQAGGFEQA